MNTKMLIGIGSAIVVIMGITMLLLALGGKNYGIPENPPTDPSCEAIDDGSFISGFDKMDCYSELAVNTHRPELCPRAHLEEATDDIYYCMYRATNDLAYCDYINLGTVYKERCVG